MNLIDTTADKNMKQKRLTPEFSEGLDNKPLEELLTMLNVREGFGKVGVIFAIAHQSRTKPELMNLVLRETASLENQSTIAMFNFTVAMSAAFAVVDDGRPEHIKALKQIIDEWADPYHAEDFYWSLKGIDIVI